MNHIDAMLDGDAYNIILCEVCANGREALANLVGLIRLRTEVNHALSCVYRAMYARSTAHLLAMSR